MYNKDLYSRALIGIGITIFIGLWLIKGAKVDISMLVIALSASGVTLVIDKFIFKQFLWKFYPDFFYKWLTTVPYLGGKWTGYMCSDYIYPETGLIGDPIVAEIEIFHNFESISIRLKTEKSNSTSYISDIFVDGGNQKYLCYIYRSDSDKDRITNPKHDGATKLRIIYDDDGVHLEGHYWTGRSTTGTMKFKRTTKKNSHV